MRTLILLLLVACRAVEPDDEKDGVDKDDVSDPDEDGDGFSPAEGDCDDNNASVHPGAPEQCNGIDDDCDGTVDEDATTVFYVDADGDGFGDPGASVESCAPPEGYVFNAADCDDARADVYPAAAEACDGVDNDCDAAVDEDGLSTWYADADGDGHGDPASATETCSPGEGRVSVGDDCDDTTVRSAPGVEEVCDELDNDCDGATDEDVSTLYYEDRDGDGYGTDVIAAACDLPTGYAERAGDCDDADPAYNPGVVEDCADPVDYNCDGSVGYADADGDGWAACTECDDADAAVHPDADEVCNDADDDCDGAVDDADPSLDASTATTFYEDDDGDGYGDPLDTALRCEAADGEVANAADCDDRAAAVSPAASEVCNDVDDDCDGAIDDADASLDPDSAPVRYLDLDGDGFGDPAAPSIACDAAEDAVDNADDCDDTDPAVHPDASEVCNGLDDDCDGAIDDDDASLALDTASTWYADADGDSYGDPLSPSVTCAPTDGAVVDADDCDDTDASVHPGATEVCSGVDEDCDGTIDALGPSVVYAGSLAAGTEALYQYSPVTPGDGYIEANWTPTGEVTEVAVGTSPGAADVLAWSSVGTASSLALAELSLVGAWEGESYYVSVRGQSGSRECATSAVSGRVQIAEAETWTGDIADLRPNDAWGGAAYDWPEDGLDAVYGAHWFETVDLPAEAAVLVQGWGAVDGVSASVGATDAAVLAPADGWLALYANDIVVAGTITASGRGYGGGGGGGGGPSTAAYRGGGGAGGLGGDGGNGGSGSGGGGGGSPGGIGGTGAWAGGDGNRYGGGSGATACSGATGRDAGDGAVSTIGGTGATASSGVVGAGGAGEFGAGGANGVAGCDSWSGGGGGGYGAGGSGGTQWASASSDAPGGGGGGTGGVGGGDTADGGAGAGPYAGSGGGGNASAGSTGGYRAAGANGDTTTDRSWALGSGGGGGGAGRQETGGGGGGAGGGAIVLYAWNTLSVESTARLLANGAGGGGGGRDNGGAATSFAGGVGAGGTLVLEARSLLLDAVAPYVSARGGGGSTTVGGTIKLFYDTLAGAPPTAAGRVYDAGSGTWEEP